MRYSDAGVDIKKEAETISSLVRSIGFSRTGWGRPLTIEGGFSAAVDFGEYALALCTDGVGSKIIIANQMKRWDTVGIDCIAMNVNDMICIGAEPIAVVDYLAMERMNPEVAAEIGKGLSAGAEMANVSIIGGETATLPDIVNGFDLCATCLGAVKKSEIITGRDVRPGDAVIGLESSGLHSNGYTLVRRLIEENGISLHEVLHGAPLGEVLLTPTRIYVREVLELLRHVRVKGMAHITGGGIRNLCRINPEVGFEIDTPVKPAPVFDFIRSLGVPDEEMYQTFNMGMGFAVVVDDADVSQALDLLGSGAHVVGKAVDRRGVSVESHHFEGY